MHEILKEGWSEYNLYFYIGSIATIIGGFVHAAGVAALIITLLFFYMMGKFHIKVMKRNAEHAKMIARKKLHAKKARRKRKLNSASQ